MILSSKLSNKFRSEIILEDILTSVSSHPRRIEILKLKRTNSLVFTKNTAKKRQKDLQIGWTLTFSKTYYDYKIHITMNILTPACKVIIANLGEGYCFKMMRRVGDRLIFFRKFGERFKNE